MGAHAAALPHCARQSRSFLRSPSWAPHDLLARPKPLLSSAAPLFPTTTYLPPLSPCSARSTFSRSVADPIRHRRVQNSSVPRARIRRRQLHSRRHAPRPRSPASSASRRGPRDQCPRRVVNWKQAAPLRLLWPAAAANNNR